MEKINDNKDLYTIWAPPVVPFRQFRNLEIDLPRRALWDKTFISLVGACLANGITTNPSLVLCYRSKDKTNVENEVRNFFCSLEITILHQWRLPFLLSCLRGMSKPCLLAVFENERASANDALVQLAKSLHKVFGKKLLSFVQGSWQKSSGPLETFIPIPKLSEPLVIQEKPGKIKNLRSLLPNYDSGWRTLAESWQKSDYKPQSAEWNQALFGLSIGSALLSSVPPSNVPTVESQLRWRCRKLSFIEFSMGSSAETVHTVHALTRIARRCLDWIDDQRDLSRSVLDEIYISSPHAIVNIILKQELERLIHPASVPSFRCPDILGSWSPTLSFLECLLLLDGHFGLFIDVSRYPVVSVLTVREEDTQ